MNCPHCSSLATTQLSRKTSLGYRIFRCRECRRIFNERTCTPYNFLEFPTDIVMLVVLWRLRYKLGLRDLAEMFLSRGFEFAHEKVTTDGHDAYPRAIRKILGRKVEHRTNKYLNNRLEQDHRGIKQRYYPMRGFGSFASASRFCIGFDEQRQYFRYRTRAKEKVPLSEQRRLFRQRFGALQHLVMAG